jgi:adenylate cyclase, class 2
MLEVEMKFPLADRAAIERQLAKLATEPPQTRIEEDQYFKPPDRDFARTDEALRIRRIGAANFVTYKGPKKDSQTKTRLEIEVPLGDGDETAADFALLLTHLRYQSVAVVRKTRTIYSLKAEDFPVELCIDDVEAVGRFAELEILAPEEQFGAARDALLALAARLGLKNSERRSYLQMLLEKLGSKETADS